jgi:hypothetical protein
MKIKKIYNYCDFWMKKNEDKEECDPNEKECDLKNWLVEGDEDNEEEEEEIIEEDDWGGEGDNEAEEKLKLPDPITCFIEAYDICGPIVTVIEEILKKKNSERTDVDKEIIRRIVRASKPERPKIILERMEENRDRVAL